MELHGGRARPLFYRWRRVSGVEHASASGVATRFYRCVAVRVGGRRCRSCSLCSGRDGGAGALAHAARQALDHNQQGFSCSQRYSSSGSVQPSIQHQACNDCDRTATVAGAEAEISTDADGCRSTFVAGAEAQVSTRANRCRSTIVALTVQFETNIATSPDATCNDAHSPA